MPNLTGKTLGSYRIIEQIGLGGMATVYKAYQPAMDRYVALKILSTHLSQSPTFIKRFQQEARVIARLEHLHILPVYDHGEEDGYLYLVMRFIQAGTLTDRLTHGALSLEEARRVVTQIGSALEYAHQLGVIHRDLKPSNILVDRQGDCYLTDFGIAKIVEGTLGLTHSGVIGTPQYMAPEQGESAKVDHRADIYAMGVVIYEMVTGRLPFDAETPFAVLMKHLTEPLPLPRQLRPDLPEEVERVILKALAKNPADRFQTMRDLVTAFDQAVQAAPAEVGVATPWPTLAALPQVAAPGDTGPLPPQPVRLTMPPLWILAAAGLGLVVLVLAGLILSQVPGRVEISGGQVQVILPTEMTTAGSEAVATTSPAAAAKITPEPPKLTPPPATPTPASTISKEEAYPTALPPQTAAAPSSTAPSASTPASPPPSLARLRWEKLADATNFLPVAINTITMAPSNPNIILVGTYGAGIYLSVDGGTTWAPGNAGLGKGTVGSIVVDPENSNNVYAALFDQGGVYKSTDGGQTWQSANKGLPLDKAWNWTGLVYLDPTDSNRLYYTGTTDGFYLSTNAGASWQPIGNDCPQVTGLAIDPANNKYLYAAAFQHPNSECLAGVYESADGGQTWQRLTTAEMVRASDQESGDWWHLATAPLDFKTIYAGGQERIYKSTDGGQTWTAILEQGCDWLAAGESAVYCGRAGNVLISSDGGQSWGEVNYDPGWGGQERRPWAIAPGSPQTIYAGSDTVKKSTDGGWTWNDVGWLGAARLRLTVDSRDGNRLFLSSVDNPGRVYRSEDGGKSWGVVLADVGGGRLTIDAGQNIIYQADGWRGLHRSTDNGQTWDQASKGKPTRSPWQVIPDPQDPTRLWGVDECGSRLAVSADKGETFAEVTSFPQPVCLPILFGGGQRLYVVHWGGFYRSDDSGKTWRSAGGLNGIYRTAAVDPSQPDVVYVGSTHQGVLKSSNGGLAWRQANTGLTSPSVNDIAVDAARPETVYVATDGGVFVSQDAGEQWWPLSTGLGPNPVVYSIVVDLSDSAKVYAATPDGVFRLVE